MQRNYNHLIIIAVGIQILFIIALAISLPKIFQSSKVDSGDFKAQPSVSIDNLGGIIPDLSSDFVKQTENQLFDLVRQNTEEVDLGATIAYIRDDPVNHIHFDDEKFDFYDFIVDIPELEQSYQLFLTVSEVSSNEYIDPNGSIIPLCLSEAEAKKYPNFDCKDIYGQGTRNLIVMNYAPYINFENFYIVMPEDNANANADNDILVVVRCHDATPAYYDSAIDELKTSIKSFGVSPDLFTYSTSESKYAINQCE